MSEEDEGIPGETWIMPQLPLLQPAPDLSTRLAALEEQVRELKERTDVHSTNIQVMRRGSSGMVTEQSAVDSRGEEEVSVVRTAYEAALERTAHIPAAEPPKVVEPRVPEAFEEYRCSALHEDEDPAIVLECQWAWNAAVDATISKLRGFFYCDYCEQSESDVVSDLEKLKVGVDGFWFVLGMI